MAIDAVAMQRREDIEGRLRASGIELVYNGNTPMRVGGRAFYYQAGGVGVAAVCSYDPSCHQWAAYIGGSGALTENEVTQEIFMHGAKMSAEDAIKLFPALAYVEYRR